MKIRLLEKELLKSGYHFIRYGKGSHRSYEMLITHHTISVSWRKGGDVKPYQLKFLRAKFKAIDALVLA